MDYIHNTHAGASAGGGRDKAALGEARRCVPRGPRVEEWKDGSGGGGIILPRRAAPSEMDREDELRFLMTSTMMRV